jgi:hypothetical protein
MDRTYSKSSNDLLDSKLPERLDICPIVNPVGGNIMSWAVTGQKNQIAKLILTQVNLCLAIRRIHKLRLKLALPYLVDAGSTNDGNLHHTPPGEK